MCRDATWQSANVLAGAVHREGFFFPLSAVALLRSSVESRFLFCGRDVFALGAASKLQRTLSGRQSQAMSLTSGSIAVPTAFFHLLLTASQNVSKCLQKLEEQFWARGRKFEQFWAILIFLFRAWTNRRILLSSLDPICDCDQYWFLL